MKTAINYFGRVMCAFLLCVGMVMTSCESQDPIDNGENTEQGGNQETPEPEAPATITLANVTYNSAIFTGHLNVAASEVPFTRVTLLYSDAETFNVVTATSISITSFDAEQNFTVTLTDLKCLTKYNYCLYVKEKSAEETYGEIQSFTTLQHPYLTEEALDVSAATDLSSTESANCYIVSETGLYKFKAVKGNSNESVGNVAIVDVLWETFGSDVTPMCGDLISGVCHKDGYIAFEVNKTFKEGNAVIHAKDAEGNIIWSWHIWLTDQPQSHVYNNNAGTMMDRNLGATSATPGDVGTFGLLYQWGRKDPFLGSSSISSSTLAKSTITWPSTVSSNSSNGTISYATAHPTTFITYNSSNYDWYYTGSSSTDNTRWSTSDKTKSIYDPCPAGWRVPDGGSNGVWSKALGSSSSFTNSSLYNSTNEGMNFSGKFGSAPTIWYPASGYRRDTGGDLYNVGKFGLYWSASPGGDVSYYAYCLEFSYSGIVYPSSSYHRADGYSVRCIKE